MKLTNKWNVDNGAIDVRHCRTFDSNHVYEAVHITNINKDTFSYTVRRCDNGHYILWIDDKLNWVAIAVEL